MANPHWAVKSSSVLSSVSCDNVLVLSPGLLPELRRFSQISLLKTWRDFCHFPEICLHHVLLSSCPMLFETSTFPVPSSVSFWSWLPHWTRGSTRAGAWKIIWVHVWMADPSFWSYFKRWVWLGQVGHSGRPLFLSGLDHRTQRCLLACRAVKGRTHMPPTGSSSCHITSSDWWTDVRATSARPTQGWSFCDESEPLSSCPLSEVDIVLLLLQSLGSTFNSPETECFLISCGESLRMRQNSEVTSSCRSLE